MLRETTRILISDDDAGDRMQLIRALRQAAFPVECRETASVEEALELCQRESFDCAIVDYLLPGNDGLSGISKLHERCPGMAILMVTGQGDVSVATEAMKRGASDYMPKPTITAESIKRAVENAIEKGRLQRLVAEQRDALVRLEGERHAAALAKELERAVEMQRVNTEALRLRDDFLSHVSHELRSPLASLASFSSIILDGLAGETTEEQREYLTIIQKNVRQLESMIEDLLTVRATQTGKLSVHLQMTSLRDAVHEAVQTCESKARAKGVELSACIASGAEMAYADPTRLVQVLIILCDNAVKFTPRGGAVKVRSRSFGQDPGFLEVEVEDTGCGISPDLIEKVFDHLYQVGESLDAGRNGLGLGLYIARELVMQHGGRIWAESSPGMGSRFCFTVPAYSTITAELAGIQASASTPVARDASDPASSSARM